MAVKENNNFLNSRQRGRKSLNGADVSPGMLLEELTTTLEILTYVLNKCCTNCGKYSVFPAELCQFP